MIKSIEFLEDYICFFEGESFELKPMTLLVGDQGCGKSTMLSIIPKLGSDDYKGLFKAEKVKSSITEYMSLDFEKDNPGMNQPNPMDSQDVFYKLTARFASHGETLLPIIEHLSTIENKLILLDEPETALSLRSQHKAIEIFKGCLERGCQIIMSTHNFLFMQAFEDSILSLEHGMYVKPNEFMELEKEENTIKQDREDKRIKKYHCRKGNDCDCTKTSSFYNNQCFHFVDREGKSGLDRAGVGMSAKMTIDYFENVPDEENS